MERPIAPPELDRMCVRMVQRGPDGSGKWLGLEGRVGLGHRRLSIIDLSKGGAQPMQSGACVVSFNGEIYNYRALRRQLEKKGYHFRSQSDTEVLLHLYAEKGEAMVHDLRGMYAFALWDGERRGLFLARDPYGIKPLYYADDGACLRVASQVKALLAGGGIDTQPEPAGHVGFFLWGHVPEPFTFYRGICALPPGCRLWVDAQGPHPVEPFAEIRQAFVEAERRAVPMGPDDARERLREALLDAVRHHMVADVDVGMFLSAGLDSATLTALAAEQGGQLRTVTLGFEDYRNTPDDEVPLAERVAARYGTEHQTVWITRDHFRRERDRLFEAMDQPATDGINSYFVSQAAAQGGLKVALSGLGGDELFGGYPSFRDIPRLVALLRWMPRAALVGRGFRAIAAPVLKRFTSPKYAGLLEYGADYGGAYLLRRGFFMPWELPSLLDGELVREGWQALQTQVRLEASVDGIASERFKVSALESTWYMRNQLLRDADWASMAHALEVRVPLVDWTLLTTVLPLFAAVPDLEKRDMARTPEIELPREVLERAKTGFTVPTRNWLLAEQAGLGRERGLRGWTRYVYNSWRPA